MAGPDMTVSLHRRVSLFIQTGLCPPVLRSPEDTNTVEPTGETKREIFRNNLSGSQFNDLLCDSVVILSVVLRIKPNEVK